jgi:hypothetical protein
MLASGYRVRGFKPGRSRRIFLMYKFSACLPSEGKSNNLSHVPTLGHVKEPSSWGLLRAAGKIRMYSFLPSLIEVSRASWCGMPLEKKEGTIPIWSTKGLSKRPRCITLKITQLSDRETQKPGRNHFLVYTSFGIVENHNSFMFLYNLFSFSYHCLQIPMGSQNATETSATSSRHLTYSLLA